MIIPSAGEYAIRSDFFKLPVWTGIRFRILGMGTIFEDLLRRFNEDNNEEAGEHWTPRDAVELMAKTGPNRLYQRLEVLSGVAAL